MSNAPHCCPFCRKNYSRTDALKRHTAKCPSRGRAPIPHAQPARGRRRHACSRCAAKKLPCIGPAPSPCRSCSKIGATCDRNLGDTPTTSTLSRQKTSGPQTSSSIAFLLCTDEEDVFSSRFNFPRPVITDANIAQRDAPEEQETIEELSWTSPSDFNFDLMDCLFSTYLDPEALAPWDTVDPSDGMPMPGTDCQDDVLIDIRKHISESPTVLALSTDKRLHVQATLTDVLTPSRVRRFLGYYWNSWHRNCRIVHWPSFEASTIEKPLLAAIISVGAMYSPYEAERASASIILPHLESYIFSQLLFDQESESRHELTEAEALAVMQAGLLVVIVMFWTAEPKVKNRASTQRFNHLASVARNMGLFRACHTLEDRRSEATWLVKETQIRTAHYVILVDCAFLFFRGLPLRVMTSEVECDLPCIETVFDAVHPFSEPDFAFRRSCPTMLVFQKLFLEDVDCLTELGLTLLDTFIMIHLMYRHVNDVLVLQLCQPAGHALQHNPFQQLLHKALTALNVWHQVWSALRHERDWDEHGFWKNGDQYELAIRLLLSDNARPELHKLLRTDVNRLDGLKELNVKTGRPP